MRKVLSITLLLFLLLPPIRINAQEPEIATESAQPTPITLPDIVVEDTPPPDLTSAQIRQKTIFRKLRKKHYQIDESVVVSLENTYDDDVNVTVLDAEGQPAALPVLTQHVADSTKVTLLPSYTTRPGKYQLRIVDSDGTVKNEDFTWGVLALNPDKSIYKPDQTAKIAIAVLDDFGAMVCNAKLVLTITNPAGTKTDLSTENNLITVNPECNLRDFTNNPDYETSYKVSQTGTYGLNLTATTANGTYSVSDSVSVQDQIAFDIQRSGPTRIYPLKSYPVNVAVNFQDDFSGQIVETIPAQFDVSQTSGTTPYSEVLTEVLTSPASTQTDLGPIFHNDYPVTQGFGEKMTDPALLSVYQNFGVVGHDGVDYSVPENTPVYAVDAGIIVQAGPGAYGTTVVIEHSWGKTYYGHLNQTQVNVNQEVKKGDQIALSGNTGISTGPHLHFGVKPKKSSFFNGYFGKVDPIPYLTNSVSSTQSVKKIVWKVSAKSGDTLTLGYIFDAPEVSPELYLTGPLKFYSTNEAIPQTEIDTSSDNPFVLGVTTQNENPILLFQENRQWQIAADADVVIDSNVPTSGGVNKGKHRLVFTTDQIGYAIYTDSDTFCKYSKTTDGGATWGAAVALSAGNTAGVCSFWYDRWTPGDVTGNYLHVIFSDANNDLLYDRVDTASSDSQAGEVVIEATSTSLGSADSISITKGTDGILYAGVADNSSGADVLTCSTTCTTGSNWTSTSDNLDSLASDMIMLQPLLSGKILLLRLDISQDDWDYDVLTGSTWAGFVDIDTSAAEGNTQLMNIAATTRLDTGDVYVSYVPNQAVDDTSEVRTLIYNGSSWTQKTDTVPDTEPATTDMVVFTDIAIDTESTTVYVLYTRGDTATTQNVYYKTSTDGMSTWGSEIQLNTSHSTDDIQQAQLNPISNERIYFSYLFNTTTDTLEGGTTVDLAPPSIDEVMRHGMWFSKAGTEMQFSF